MTDHTWHLSGLDAHDHAFRTEGGYLHSIWRDAPDLPEPAEYKVTECGIDVPTGFLMHTIRGQRCPDCLHLIAPPLPPGLLVLPIKSLAPPLAP